MQSEWWQRLERLFAEARELPADERRDFVAHHSEDDATLRDETFKLLSADDVSGPFMTADAIDVLARRIAARGTSLAPGEQLGAYCIVALLGSGSAGEVWRAHDGRLGRDVAIKILRPYFAGDADRLRRFAEEARAAGALNHSNILTVFDVGDHQGLPFIVSECLEGRSLRHRLEAGQLPLDEVLSVAVGVARGLTAAHAHGMIHRDLKPENTFLRSDGGVKILDFGLAKLQASTDGSDGPPHQTMTGLIVGTAGYMAPEQVRGEPIDGRADLFALGVMLYEMLGGRHPFRRDSAFETLHAVLTFDPPDVQTVDGRIPPALSAIVMRLLRKAPAGRFQSALDLTWALEQIAAEPRSATITVPRVAADGRSRVRWRSWVAGTAAAAIVAAAVGALWLRNPTRQVDPPQLRRFTWSLPAGTALDSAPVVSPDSRFIAFIGRSRDGTSLFVRDLGSLEATSVPGTQGARQPFWSPDSRFIAFFAAGRLLKLAWPGGAPGRHRRCRRAARRFVESCRVDSVRP